MHPVAISLDVRGMRGSSANVSEKFDIACTVNPAAESTDDIACRRIARSPLVQVGHRMHKPRV